MDWKILYKDWRRFDSSEFEWEDLPKDGVIRIDITLPSGGNMQVSGWDHYVLRQQIDGVQVYMWKDKDPVDIDGNPIHDDFAGMYCMRIFYNNGTSVGPVYSNNVNLPLFSEEEVKDGRWVDDETAKQMGI